MIREDFLQQNSYDEIDSYSSLRKQFLMLRTILHYYDKAASALELDVPLANIVAVPERGTIATLKRIKDDEVEKACAEIVKSLDKSLQAKR